MDFKLIWSESAIADLAGIVRFIALRDGTQMAREAGFGIYDRAQILIRHPQAGSVLAEKQDARWRKLIYKSWKIAYRIDQEAKAVYVVRRLEPATKPRHLARGPAAAALSLRAAFLSASSGEAAAAISGFEGRQTKNRRPNPLGRTVRSAVRAARLAPRSKEPH